ncbi:MAG TPA: hypothetical protein VID47_06080 [Actinomycetota bacterium]|jgi:Mn2+/Fe2+ NRAMP family transporter
MTTPQINWSVVATSIVAVVAIVANVIVTRSTRSHERRMKVLEWRREAYVELLQYLLAWTFVLGKRTAWGHRP